MQLKLNPKRVLVKEIKPVNPSGLIIINHKATVSHKTAEVIQGTTTDIQPGNIVIISKYCGQKLYINDEEFILVHTAEILAKIIKE